MRKLLFRLATWRDPRNQILPADRAEEAEMRANPSIEGNIKTVKALAVLRYIRELNS